MRRGIASGVVVAAMALPAIAAIETATLINDNMVLQRERPVPIWGRATAGNEIEVSFAGQEKTARVAADGTWRVDLDQMKADAEGKRLVITESEPGWFGSSVDKKVFTNVVVGEVWLCGGQSNMTFAMWPNPAVGTHEGREMNGYYDLALTHQPLIRGVRMPNCWYDVETNHAALTWMPFVPESQLGRFSAAAWHFAMRLYASLGIPVGVIESAWGGTCIETWISPRAYARSKSFKDLATKKIPMSVGKDGRLVDAHQSPRACWNAMIWPLAPYAVRGAIWYQGCANRGRWRQYYEMLEALRSGWGEAFECGPEMPFFICQITPFDYNWGQDPDPESKDDGECQIREEMERWGRDYAPFAGCVNISDVGELDCIHPGDKRTVGTRLAAMALNRIYGFKDLKCDAPTFREAVLSDDGKKVAVSFDNVTGWCRKGTYRERFELAGADGKYVPVSCHYVANVPTVDLDVPSGMVPKKVAYLRKSCSHGFLKNEAGIPLGPFRGNVKNPKPAVSELNPVVPFLAITGRPTEADIKAKVAALKADGYDQFLVYARSGLQYKYMGEEWLRTVEACCREGQKRGMKVWLYDEFNWPSGTCKGRVPDADKRFLYSEWAVYPKEGGGYRWEIVYAPSGWVNVCEPDAIKLFIKMTHEVYEKRLAKYFADKVIPGIFSDEPGHPVWIPPKKDCRVQFRRWIGMEDEYRAETGRDFRADIEAAIGEKPSAAAQSVWATYLRLMGRRFRSSYFDQIRAWCDKMGIVLTGHLIAESSLESSCVYNGDPLYVLKGESLPGMDEIFSNSTWGDGVGWDGGTEWMTFATMQHAAFRVKRGGLVELFACGPNDMSAARMRQMIWMCAFHGVDHYLTSMQIMDHRGLVQKHGYVSPVQNGQPWHTEMKPLFDDARIASRLARRQDVVRHAAVRHPHSAASIAAMNKKDPPKFVPLLRAFGGGQLSVDLIAEDEKSDLPYIFEALTDGTYRETRTGTDFKGDNAADEAAAWLRGRTLKSARFLEKDGKPALGLLVREWSDGTVAAIDIKNSGRRELTLVRGDKKDSMVIESRGIAVVDAMSSPRQRKESVSHLTLPSALPYSLDRDPVFRLPFSTNGVAHFSVKDPIVGARLVLRTCAMSYAVTASGRPVDDGEGEPAGEQVLRHTAVPYTFEFDGKPVAAARKCSSLPVEFCPLYAETEPFVLTAGEHTIRLVTGEEDHNYFLPAAFMAGAFAEKGGTLAKLPEKLAPGKIAEQGLAGYCGTVTYTLDGVSRPQDGIISLNVGNTFAHVKWNGVDFGTRAWAPYEWQLPEGGKSTGKLEVKVFTHVWDIFGPRDRKDMNWDMRFWIPQHDTEVNPGLGE